MPDNKLLSETELDFKELEQMRRDLTVKVLQEQRDFTQQVEALQAKIARNKHILAQLAEKPTIDLEKKS